MTDKNDVSRRTRHASRASFACYRCKKAKRRCDISEQAESSESCTTCRLRNEKCDFRLRGDDKRKQRQSTKVLQARVIRLENELKDLSSQGIQRSSGPAPIEQPTPESQHHPSSVAAEPTTTGKFASPSDLPTTTSMNNTREHSNSSPRAMTSPFSTTSMPQSLHNLHTRANSFVASPNSARSWENMRNTKTPRRFPIGLDEVTPPEGSMDPQEYGNKRYFGASSMFPYGERQLPSPRHTDILAYIAEKRELSPSSLQDFVEPEPIVSHLLNLFWTYQVSHLLVVDRTIFLRHRQNAHDNDGVADRNFYTPCLLYSILALASLISTDKGVKRYSTERGIVGDRFHRRARTLFDMEMESPTVTTVQAAILIGSWYGTLVDNSLGWVFSGIGFRLATKLGLHLDCSRMIASNQMTEEEAHIRAMAFWGSYVEDKLYSAYCQRPTMLMDWDITISPPTESSSGDHLPPNLLPYTVYLSQICGRTLLGLYAQRHFNSENDGIKKIAFDIHTRLWEWQRKLPSDLMWPAEDATAPTPPSVLVLHMQFYYNLILVHRPLLEFSKAKDELSQGRNASQTTSTTTCTIAAANITKLIHDYCQHYDIRQISPNGVHIAFIAATIHLINYRLTGVESHSQLLSTCVTALDELGDSYAMGQKAVHILNSLIRSFRPLDDTANHEQEILEQDLQHSAPQQKGIHAENTSGQSVDSPLDPNAASGLEVSSEPAQDLFPCRDHILPDMSANFGIPLGIPRPMEVEGFGDAAHHAYMQNDHRDFIGHHMLHGLTTDFTSFGQGLNLGDVNFPMISGMDGNSLVSINMEDRDLFHAFYGTASSLY